MFFKNTKLLSRTKRLEIQIEEFLDKVTESTELFSIAFKVYLAEGVDTQFEEFMNKIQEVYIYFMNRAIRSYRRTSGGYRL